MEVEMDGPADVAAAALYQHGAALVPHVFEL